MTNILHLSFQRKISIHRFWHIFSPPLFTARCYAECGYATVCRPSVCNVQVPWSHRLEFFENNFMAE